MGSSWTLCLLYTILCVVFEARVINFCDRDITTNFGVVAGEVILVDSCACTVIFICCDSKKKETEFLLAAVLFKTDFLVELGIVLLFPEGKKRSE
jgi:hypothetical protein